MAKRQYQPIDASKIRTYSASRRAHKMRLSDAAALPDKGASAAALIDSFSPVLGARAFQAVVDAVVAARRADRPVVLAFGAHVIKVGCAPVVVDLIRRGIVTAVAGNGATAIHDAEVALLGETSEEVADTIRDGRFGMVSETLAFFARVANRAAEQRIGLGESVGRCLLDEAAQHSEQSVFAAACRAQVPAAVFVGIGTDTVHMAPDADGGKIGAASMHDFRLICDVVADLGAETKADAGRARPDGGKVGAEAPGGVWLNVGSAVVMPEVFLKAVSVARNLGADLDAMVTGNFDMQRHYRPWQNVVQRPVAAGHGHEVIGHHEMLLPLLRQAVIEKLE